MLEVTDIEATYDGAIRAVAGVSIKLAPGRIVALLGPNGAGKTTLLKAIAGLLPMEHGRVTGGSVSFDGDPVLGTPAHMIARRGICYVHEGRKIFSSLSVDENLVAATQALKGRRSTSKPNFERVYEMFPELGDRRGLLAGYLSGGERQMLSIGRAIISDPKLILLDEPSLGLAPKMVTAIFKIVRRINSEWNVSVLLADQNAVATLKICHYGYVMEQGHIVLEGSPDALKEDPEVQAAYLGSKTEKM